MQEAAAEEMECGGGGGGIEFRRRSLPRGDKLTCSSSGGPSGPVYYDGRRSQEPSRRGPAFHSFWALWACSSGPAQFQWM